MERVVKESHRWFKNFAEEVKNGSVLMGPMFDSVLEKLKDRWREEVSKMLEIFSCDPETIRERLNQIEVYQKIRDIKSIVESLMKIRDIHQITSGFPRLAAVMKSVRKRIILNKPSHSCGFISLFLILLIR